MRGNEKVSTDPDFKGLVDFMHSDDTAFMNVGINIGYVSSILTLPVLPKIIDDCKPIKTAKAKARRSLSPKPFFPSDDLRKLGVPRLGLARGTCAEEEEARRYQTEY